MTTPPPRRYYSVDRTARTSASPSASVPGRTFLYPFWEVGDLDCIKCRQELPEEAAFCPWCGKKQMPAPRRAVKRSNGTGTVYKLTGRRKRPWVAAKSRVVLGYYPTRRDAVTALEGLAGRAISDRYNMTFAEVFAAWSAEHYPGIGPQGIDGYDRAFKVFAPLHDRQFRGLRTADYQAIMDGHMGQSHSTCSKYKQLLTQMSSWAIREELIGTNFASFVRLPPDEKKEKDIFTPEEIQRLEEHSDEDAAKLVLMLVYTGMRIGELFGLRVADCHGDYVIGGEKTAAGRNRVIPIRPEGREYFAYFAGRADPDGLLVSGYNGSRVAANFRKRDYYPLLERLGVRRLTPHTTRHTYASWARQAGVAPDMLQKILGHANYSTTANIYLHANAEELVAAVTNTLLTNQNVLEKG